MLRLARVTICLASLAALACSDPVAPTPTAPTIGVATRDGLVSPDSTCRSGYNVSNGRC